jgi:oligopeptide transport system substrate-binding protein
VHNVESVNAASFFPVPAHAVRRWGDAWTRPGRYVGNGPYTLVSWRLGDYLRVEKNPLYYDAAKVLLEEIVFLPVTDGATSVNLYKTGSAYAMHGRAVPPLWIPALRGRRDFHSAPAYRDMFYAFNTRRPPFDNALVRRRLSSL